MFNYKIIYLLCKIN